MDLKFSGLIGNIESNVSEIPTEEKLFKMLDYIVHVI